MTIDAGPYRTVSLPSEPTPAAGRPWWRRALCRLGLHGTVRVDVDARARLRHKAECWRTHAHVNRTYGVYIRTDPDHECWRKCWAEQDRLGTNRCCLDGPWCFVGLDFRAGLRCCDAVLSRRRVGRIVRDVDLSLLSGWRWRPGTPEFRRAWERSATALGLRLHSTEDA